MGERMFGTRSGGIQRKGNAPAYAGEQRLQIVNGIGGTLVLRPRRIGKTQHGIHLGLIRRKQQIGVFPGRQMNAIANVKQAFNGLIVAAMRAVGQP